MGVLINTVPVDHDTSKLLLASGIPINAIMLKYQDRACQINYEKQLSGGHFSSHDRNNNGVPQALF